MKTSLCTLVIATLLCVSSGLALPRFAARTGAKCASCHVNPSGAGMRQAFGVKYGQEDLPVPAWSKDFELEDFSNLLTNFVGIGADFRTLYFIQQIPDATKSTNNGLFQMQGDIYLDLKVAKKVSMYLSKGLYSGFEIFGLLNILPERGYIKIGKFLPDVGIKTDDHTDFTRTYTGFSPELARPELTGGEVGLLPGPFTFTAGFYNATDGFGAATGKNKAYLGRAEGMFKLSDQADLWIGADIFGKNGGSLATRTLAGNITTLSLDNMTLWGGFGALNFHMLTIQGEADMLKTKVGGVSTTAIITTVEANYPVTQGLDLKVGYDFYDPDKDLKTGSISRYSFGFEFFPLPGVEVRPIYRLVKDQPVDLHNDEFDLLFHFYM